jgi:uncharacterized membrane protein YdjX (TVP38/TMEM64 family)
MEASAPIEHGDDRPGRTAARAKPWVRPLLLLLGLGALAAVARVLGLGDRLAELRAWILDLGAWGPAVFIALYAAAVAVAVPGSVLTVAAGAMFGSLEGVVVVSVASTLGAAAGFAMARWIARDAVARWLQRSARFARLDALTRRHGAVMVAITRLVPLFPFTLLNYGFGLTRVRFRTYLFWSWLCMLPGTVLYVVGGDALTRGVSQGKVPWTLVGVIAVVAVTLTLLVRHARGTLRASGHEEDS